MFLKVQQRWLHLSYRASFIWACIPITIHEHYIVYRPQKEAYLKTLSALEAAIRLYGLMFKHLISSTELKEAEVTLRKMGPAASFWAMISCLQQFKEWAEEHVALEKACMAKEQAGRNYLVYDIEKFPFKSYMTVDYCEKRQQQVYDLIDHFKLWKVEGKVDFERNELYVRGAVDVKDNTHVRNLLSQEKALRKAPAWSWRRAAGGKAQELTQPLLA